MEIIKWFASTVIGLVVVGALASAAFAVASFMFAVQIWGFMLMVTVAAIMGIKEFLFGDKEK